VTPCHASLGVSLTVHRLRPRVEIHVTPIAVIGSEDSAAVAAAGSEDSMIERGSGKHGPELDDQIEHETSGMISGNQPAHVEEHRETEAFPDDTDPQEVQDAAQLDVPAGVDPAENDDEEEK
jgi:hypothetical protein